MAYGLMLYPATYQNLTLKGVTRTRHCLPSFCDRCLIGSAIQLSLSGLRNIDKCTLLVVKVAQYTGCSIVVYDASTLALPTGIARTVWPSNCDWPFMGRTLPSERKSFWTVVERPRALTQHLDTHKEQLPSTIISIEEAGMLDPRRIIRHVKVPL